MKVVALRSRAAGGGFKPPRAALAEDCCGERSRKRHPARCQVGVRETSASESLLTCRNKDRRHRNRSIAVCSGMSLAGARRLARRCPAWRRREPDLLRPNGTGESAHRHGAPHSDVLVGGARRGSAPVAVRAGGPARSSGEVPVMGAERRGRVVRGFLLSINHTAIGGGGTGNGNARIVRQAVRYLEAGRLGCLGEGENQSGCAGGG